jgi:pimeloyl-ACP methyl ester carboxylesterase
LTLVFFITGNPGLIAYYHPFLSLLVERLKKRKEAERPVVVAGFSLGGFDAKPSRWATTGANSSSGNDDRYQSTDGDAIAGDEEMIQEILYPPLRSRQASDDYNDDRIYTLREQIELTYARLEALVARLRLQFRRDNYDLDDESELKPVKVVLTGHSVGTYIALELVRLWHEREMQHPAFEMERGREKEENGPSWMISSCILLTPTIVDLHMSPSGRIATPLLTSIPVLSAYLPDLAHGLLHSVLVRGLPSKWMASLVARVTGMHVGSHGFDATMAFLTSRSGVRQALTMAAAELKEIRADQWGAEVWGAAVDEEEGDTTRVIKASGSTRRRPRLYLWFAKEDHWVADITREEILRSKVGTEGENGGRTRPTIVIDETAGLVHAWCLEQSDMVAERVGEWLEEILEHNA